METQNNLLDKCKKASNAMTDMALADALGVGRAAVSKYRKGLSHPDAVVCARISALTGEPLARVLGIVGEERAISREEKQVWRRLAAAASICFVTLLALPLGAKAMAPSHSAIAGPEQNHGLGIMRKSGTYGGVALGRPSSPT